MTPRDAAVAALAEALDTVGKIGAMQTLRDPDVSLPAAVLAALEANGWTLVTEAPGAAPRLDLDAIRQQVIEDIEEADRSRSEDEGGIDVEAIGNLVYEVLRVAVTKAPGATDTSDTNDRPSVSPQFPGATPSETLRERLADIRVGTVAGITEDRIERIVRDADYALTAIEKGDIDNARMALRRGFQRASVTTRPATPQATPEPPTPDR